MRIVEEQSLKRGLVRVVQAVPSRSRCSSGLPDVNDCVCRDVVRCDGAEAGQCSERAAGNEDVRS